jgi:peptide/nickel transport system substrate-binding protein
MTTRKRQVAGLAAATAAALLSTACSFGGVDSSQQPGDRPEVEDVGARDKVPTIRLLTKTAANDPTRFEMSRMIVEAWQQAGIPAELMPVDDAQLNTLAFESKDYDVYAVSYGPSMDRLDPDNLLARFTSNNATDTGSNVSMYSSDEYDDAYAQQARALDEDSRRDLVNHAQEILYADLPAVPLFYPTVGAAYRSDRWDGIEQAVGYPVFNVWNATRATPTDGRDTLVVGTTFEPSTLNPVVADTLESQIPLSLIYDTVLAIGPDGETVNRAAEDIEVDGTRITLRLRNGLTFSDGRPVRAEDVAFSIEYLKKNAAPLFAGPLESVDSVTSADGIVEITLAEPTPQFPDVSLTQLPILPEHVWASVDPADFANEKPVGSGPFTLTDRRLGSSLSFTANKDHYDPPVVANLELVILGSFDAGIGAVESGEIDLYDDVQPALEYESLKDVNGVTVVETQSHGWRGLHFNTSRAPMDDVHFRRALTDLIPFEDILDVVMRGDAQPGGSVIAPVLEDWHNSDLDAFEYDGEAAMASLEEAGYAFGPDGELYYPDPAEDGRQQFADGS